MLKHIKKSLFPGNNQQVLILTGSVLILIPVFIFIILQKLNDQEAFGTQLLFEKGAALIRSIEAGTRVGMMEERWGDQQLFWLLNETVQQPDIAYIMLVDHEGRIIIHNNKEFIGEKHSMAIEADASAAIETPQWRVAESLPGTEVFEVFKSFRPSMTMGRMSIYNPDLPHKSPIKSHQQRQLNLFFNQFGFIPPGGDLSESFVPIIIVGFYNDALKDARSDDTKRTIISVSILFLASVFGICLLAVVQNHRNTRHQLTGIKAFSDSLVDNLPIGLVAFREDAHVISINPFAKTLLQIGPGGFSGKPAGNVLPPELWSEVSSLMKQTDPFRSEITCKLKSGKFVPLELELSHFKVGNPQKTTYLLLIKDLTLVRSLMKKAMRSQRLASIGNLAAGVAHEIRNPLSSIKGFATYFKNRYQDVPQDQKISGIMIQEVERVDHVVGDLLNLTKPIEIKPQACDLDHLMDDLNNLIEAKARKNSVKIKIPARPIGTFNLDKDRVMQILLNLSLNAIDAMPEGGDLTIEMEDKQNWLVMKVADTGSGISDENLSRIYDPYFTTKPSGTGLGLAVVHSVVEAYNGELLIESQPKKGTVFTISLPKIEREITP